MKASKMASSAQYRSSKAQHLALAAARTGRQWRSLGPSGGVMGAGGRRAGSAAVSAGLYQYNDGWPRPRGWASIRYENKRQ